jgi:pyridoxal 5'-phosphate synthase pdxS subunit
VSEDNVIVNRGLAKMLKGGVIMDVVNAKQAVVAEKAGACAVMALERIPADIRAAGGVARMSDVDLIKSIQDSVSIPVMAKCRIGHIAEAQILQSLAVDYIDESEVLTPADELFHIDKTNFKIPFVCGAKNLGEALRRISEGASMLRTKGEAGTGNIVEAVRHTRDIASQLKKLLDADESSCLDLANKYRVPVSLINEVRKLGRLPVVNFAAGGIATPADVSLMMQLGSEGVFVGSGIFKSSDPQALANACVQAVVHYNDPSKLAEISAGLGEAMKGLCIKSLKEEQLYAARGE